MEGPHEARPGTAALFRVLAGPGRGRRVGGRRPAEDSALAAAAAQLQKMNNLSFSELCCLFCCPPCPGKIASKLAFLPPDPTYTLMCDESGSRWTLHLSERADWQYSSREKDAIECFMTRTSKGNRIAFLESQQRRTCMQMWKLPGWLFGQDTAFVLKM